MAGAPSLDTLIVQLLVNTTSTSNHFLDLVFQLPSAARKPAPDSAGQSLHSVIVQMMAVTSNPSKVQDLVAQLPLAAYSTSAHPGAGPALDSVIVQLLANTFTAPRVVRDLIVRLPFVVHDDRAAAAKGDATAQAEIQRLKSCNGQLKPAQEQIKMLKSELERSKAQIARADKRTATEKGDAIAQAEIHRLKSQNGQLNATILELRNGGAGSDVVNKLAQAQADIKRLKAELERSRAPRLSADFRPRSITSSGNAHVEHTGTQRDGANERGVSVTANSMATVLAPMPSYHYGGQNMIVGTTGVLMKQGHTGKATSGGSPARDPRLQFREPLPGSSFPGSGHGTICPPSGPRHALHAVAAPSKKRAASAGVEDSISKKIKTKPGEPETTAPDDRKPKCSNCVSSGLSCNQQAPCNNCGPHNCVCMYYQCFQGNKCVNQTCYDTHPCDGEVFNSSLGFTKVAGTFPDDGEEVAVPQAPSSLSDAVDELIQGVKKESVTVTQQEAQRLWPPALLKYEGNGST